MFLPTWQRILGSYSKEKDHDNGCFLNFLEGGIVLKSNNFLLIQLQDF